MPVDAAVTTGTETVAFLTLVVLAAVPAAWLAYRILSHPNTWRQGFLTVALRAFCATMFRQHVRHVSTVPSEGGALVVANHRSPTDPLIMHAAASFQREGSWQRVVEWITAREYVEIGGPIGWICRAAFSIPVDRGGNDMAAVKEAMKRLKAGRVIGIFPEGKINVGEGLLPFNPGLSFLATRGGVPVIPAFIEDAPGGPAMKSMVQPFLTPTTARVRFGEPIDYSHIRRPTAKQRDEITDEIREAIIALMPPSKQRQTRVRDLAEKANEGAATEAASNGAATAATDAAPPAEQPREAAKPPTASDRSVNGQESTELAESNGKATAVPRDADRTPQPT